MRTIDKKLECLKKVLLNSQWHITSNDPSRIYSQYVRYALDEFKYINLHISEKAKKLKRKDVIHEHVIPHAIVMKKLLSLDQPTTDEILLIIKNYYFLCLITKDEDELLTAAGLRSKMPQGWDEGKNSVFARYEKVGIKIHKISNNI